MERTPTTEKRYGESCLLFSRSPSWWERRDRPARASSPGGRRCRWGGGFGTGGPHSAGRPPHRQFGQAGERVCFMQIAQKSQNTRGICRNLLALAVLPALLLAGCRTGEGTGALVGAGAG